MTLSGYPTHIRLAPGQTGLPETSELQPEQITAVRKEYLKPRPGTRTQAESIIITIAKNVVFSLGVQPESIQ
jgi:mRNA-degrading endonuclease toxin of MazEF toxin-antitoxin module